ncbi:MAG: DUF503 domain-containing protein [Deltaproteobacteria bacterium]|nr:DUF503 domain-containing protein [Deltaproteobacteria bacterium]
MYVGILRLGFQIPGARSLKDRRRVVRSFKDRLQAGMRVSVAEVGDLTSPQHATVAVAVVSNEAARCDELLASAARLAGSLRDAVLADRRTEIVSFSDSCFGEGGREPGAGAVDYGEEP